MEKALSSKKIICTVTNDLTYDQRMIRICTSLSALGYEVELVGRKRPNSKPFKKEPFAQKRLQCYFQKGKWFYVEYNIRLFFYLLSQKVDIICSVDLDTLLPGVALARLRGKKVVYDAHEYFTEVPELVNRPAIQAIWERIAQWAIPQVDKAYTVCESLAVIFKERYGKAFEVVRNVPFRRPLAEKKQLATPPVILYQGVLNEGRGLEAAITVMQQIDHAQLWLAGEGDLSQELRTLAQSLEVGEKVKFLGYIRPDELKAITLQATIGLNLLENKGLNYYYSLANKAFDYIQAALPSIHMNFPEYKLLQNKYQPFQLIPDLDPIHLHQAITQLLDDQEHYQELVNNCLKARQVLIWELESRKLEKIYDF